MPGLASAPNHSDTSTTSRSTETHCASAVAGISPRSMPGASFTPVGRRSAKANDGVQRRRPVGRVGQPPGGGAPGRVEVDAVDVGRIERLGVGVHHRGIRPRGEVVCGDRGGHLVALERGHLDVQRGQRQGVAADPAAEVGDAAEARRTGTGRRAPRRRTSRVACSSPAGVNSIRSANSPNLAAARRRSFDWVSTAATRAGEWPGRAQRAHGAHDIRLRVVGRQRVEQAQPVGRQQGHQFGLVHRPILSEIQETEVRRRTHGPGDTGERAPGSPAISGPAGRMRRVVRRPNWHSD